MKATNQQINWVINEMLACIRNLRSVPTARAEVREAIRRVRQLRGILEARGL